MARTDCCDLDEDVSAESRDGWEVVGVAAEEVVEAVVAVVDGGLEGVERDEEPREGVPAAERDLDGIAIIVVSRARQDGKRS